MTRISSEHEVTTTKMEQLYVRGMTMEREKYMMSSLSIEGCEKNYSRS